MPDEQERTLTIMPTASLPTSSGPSTNRLIFHVQFFRRARPEELKQKLWTEFWYTPRAVVRHLPSRDAAYAEAEKRCADSEWREGWIVREGEEPDPEGWLKPGWHVYQLELVKAGDITRVGDGTLAAWVPENDGPSFRGEKLALSQARSSWRKGDGRSAFRVMAEAVTLRELVQRRATALTSES